MRLRSTLIATFVALAAVQVLVVVPIALRNLDALLTRQTDARIAQLMVAVDAERERLGRGVHASMNELVQSPAFEAVTHDELEASNRATTAAQELMSPRGLDVLALLDGAGRTLSSGHLPPRLGEPDDPLFAATRAPATALVPLRVELPGPDGLRTMPALVSARRVEAGGRALWVVGGVLLDDARAQALHRLTGARVEVWSGGGLSAAAGPAVSPAVVHTLSVGDAAELRLHFSTADAQATGAEVLRAFLALAALGALLAVALGWAVSRRITRPVEALTEAARRIAQGEPGQQVDVGAAAVELRALVDTFNRMTDDLKRATERLVASERVAAWHEVARRLAHEIKNPLTPIRLSLETLLAASQRGSVDARFHQLFKESATAMLEEVARLTRIVDEFSQFARLPRPNLAPLDLSEAVRQVMALYSSRPGLTYSVEVAPNVLVLGDRDQLTQVLVNLVKNAEEALSSAGGVISVRLTAERVLSVEDDGPGVPAELKARLFEPYVTTKQHGTGLGLAIAARIAGEHGGQLELDDLQPHGARFRLSLPPLTTAVAPPAA